MNPEYKNPNPYRKETGHIDYSSFKYDLKKSYRNRVFMGKFDWEFNNGFGNKYYNTLNIGKPKVRTDFKNWNNSIGFSSAPTSGRVFRRIVFQTVAQTFQQDQILRDIIENKEYLNIENIVAIDVEYGGGKTVPRVGIVNFNEEPVYYSDFCLRYNDWEETKKIMKSEQIRVAKEAEEIMKLTQTNTHKKAQNNQKKPPKRSPKKKIKKNKPKKQNSDSESDSDIQLFIF